MINKLQNDFTTPEQSKRLLGLGVPNWSADEYRDEKGYRHSLEGILDVELFFQNFPDYLPCWSFGRLMEILMICNTYFAPKEFKIEPNSMIPTLIENIVNKIEELEGYDMLDFSKLED